MSGEFKRYSPALLGNRYLVVPIVPGQKRPSIQGWEQARITTADIHKYNGDGVGILCGQGDAPLVAIDIDVRDATVADAFSTWCREHLGATAERVGFAPKTLLVYRAEGAWAKLKSPWFHKPGVEGKHRVELLGNGQQFVAYAIHPDTAKPYEWVDPFGGIEYLGVDDLPIVTQEQVQEALSAFHHVCELHGYVVYANGSAGSAVQPANESGGGGGGGIGLGLGEQPLGLTIAQMRDMLDFVEGEEDYDTWIKVGLALHTESAGDSYGLELWNEWSRQAANYASHEDLQARWASFERDNRRITGVWLRAQAELGKKATIREGNKSDLDRAQEAINRCKHADELLNEVAQSAGAIGRNEMALQLQIENTLRARFEQLTGTKLSLANARTALTAVPSQQALLAKPEVSVLQANTRHHPFNQLGNCNRMLDRYGANLMYVIGLGWFKWVHNNRWVPAFEDEVEGWALETTRALKDEADTLANPEAREAMAKFASMSQSSQMVASMAKLATLSPGIAVKADALDRNRTLLGVNNGVVDLTTGLLLPADRKHRLTMNCGIDYIPAADSSLWESTLQDVFGGDLSLVSFLQRLVGYALLGDPKEDVLAIPYGMGCNGKSTVFNVIRAAFGDYGRMGSAGTFMTSGTGSAISNSGPREDILRLRNARLVYVTEANEGSVLREDIVKSMTGGEPIPARGLFEKTTIEVKPTWLCIMPTNHKPVITGEDHGIWRRLLPVPFTVNFDDETLFVKDASREDKLLEQLPAVLAWCVQGALDYQRQGLAMPAQVTEAISEYKTDMDLLSTFIAEACEVGHSRRASLSQLWAAWRQWAEPRGELKLVPSSRQLMRRLRSRYQADKGSMFRGIAPKGLEPGF